MTNHVPMIGGAVTYWNISQETNREALYSGLVKLNVSRYCPLPRTTLSTLSEALRAVYGKTEVLIRPLDKKTENGFAVVREIRGNRRNDYATIKTAKIDAAGNIELLVNNGNGGFESDYDYDLVQAFKQTAGTLPNESVSKCLVDIVGHLNGTSLKESGGVYYIPETSMDEWTKIAEVVESSSVGKPSRVQMLRTVVDENSVRAVKEAIENEAMTAAAEMQKEIAESGLGVKGLENREKRTTAIHAKLRAYERILGEAMTAAHDAVSKAAQAAAAAKAVAEHGDGGVFEGVFNQVVALSM